jgi:hypothetical protein
MKGYRTPSWFRTKRRLKVEQEKARTGKSRPPGERRKR